MLESIDPLEVGWFFGLLGAFFGILAIWHIQKAQNGLQNSALGKGMFRVGYGTIYIIAGCVNMGLILSKTIDQNMVNATVTGLLLFLAGLMLFLGYREFDHVIDTVA